MSLWIVMESPAEDYATLARFYRPNQGDIIATDHTFKNAEGKREHQELRLPTDVTEGKLRLVRKGSKLIYMTGRKGEDYFEELREEEFGTYPLTAVRAAADTGGAAVKVDVLIEELEIRAGDMSTSLSQAQKKTSSRNYYILGGVALLGILLGGYFWMKKKDKE